MRMRPSTLKRRKMNNTVKQLNKFSDILRETLYSAMDIRFQANEDIPDLEESIDQFDALISDAWNISDCLRKHEAEISNFLIKNIANNVLFGELKWKYTVRGELAYFISNTNNRHKIDLSIKIFDETNMAIGAMYVCDSEIEIKTRGGDQIMEIAEMFNIDKSLADKAIHEVSFMKNEIRSIRKEFITYY